MKKMKCNVGIVHKMVYFFFFFFLYNFSWNNQVTLFSAVSEITGIQTRAVRAVYADSDHKKGQNVIFLINKPL